MGPNPKENDPEGFTLETKAPPIPFKDVHPGPQAGQKFKGKDTVPWGGSDGLESTYHKCKQCGFIWNEKRNSPGSGWGNDNTTTYTAGDGSTIQDPISTAGCPFCNASELE
jgi:hypothetical protein